MSERLLEHYFDYTRQMGEMIFQMKLELFEGSSVALLEAALLSHNQHRVNDANNNSNAAKCDDDEDTKDSSAQGGKHNNSGEPFAAFLTAAQATQQIDVTSEAGRKPRTDFLDEADRLVYNLYKELPSGFTTTTTTTTAAKSSSGGAGFDPMLYGEIEPQGLREMLFGSILPKAMEFITRRNLPPPFRVTFVDLGSGTGKAVFDVVLSSAEMPGFELSGVGVELDEQRAAVAKAAFDKVSSLQVVRERVKFVQGDMLADPRLFCGDAETDDGLSTRGVFAFCCGVAFDDEMRQAIVERVLDVDKQPGLGLVGAVFLFKQWPADTVAHVEAAGWKISRTHVATTWMSEAPAFLLEKG